MQQLTFLCSTEYVYILKNNGMSSTKKKSAFLKDISLSMLIYFSDNFHLLCSESIRRCPHDCTKELLRSLIVLQWSIVLNNAEKPVLCSNKISLYDRLYASVTRQVPLDHVHRSSATGTGYEEEQGQPIRQKADKFLTRRAGTLDRTGQDRTGHYHVLVLPFAKYSKSSTEVIGPQRLCPYIKLREPGVWFSWDMTWDSATAMCVRSLTLVKI